eukprot:XP_004911521.1 PREDICTED: fibrinogen alpha chain-like [Xenopus tropicalis]
MRCPSGCRVQGLINKRGKEFMTRIDRAKRSNTVSYSSHIESLSAISQLHDVFGENMIRDKDAITGFARTGEELRIRLLALKLKVKKKAVKIEGLLRNLQDQLMEMKRIEVDIDIKIRSCKGSCSTVQLYMISLDSYAAWKAQLASLNTNNMKAMPGHLRPIHLLLVQQNTTSLEHPTVITDGKHLGVFENIQQYTLKLGDYNETNTV